MNSIDYDVNLDFLLSSPKTPPMPVSDVETHGEVLGQNDSIKHFPAEANFMTPEPDYLITPDRYRTKVPSVDRSSNPPSLMLNNSISDPAVNSGGQSAVSVTRINNKLTSDKNVDQPNSISDTRSLNKPGSSTVGKSTSGPPPVAPDRSTKPVASATTSLSTDVSAHSARVEREQAELDALQAKKMQEASALANLMREKRKLEIEMSKKKKRQNDVQPRTK